jgi:hypothetical protein
MAFNIIGAMLGGLLEYNSMYFGFSSLYLFAAVMYAAAFVSARGGAKLHLPTQALGSG